MNESSQASLEIGKTYAQQEKFDLAIEQFKKICQSEQNNEHAHFELGKIYYIQKRIPESIEELKAAIKITDGNKYAHFLLAKAYQEDKEPILALKEYKKAQELGCDNEEIHQGLGFIYQEMGKFELAIEELKKVAGTDIDIEHMRLVLGKNYYHNGKYELAIGEFKKVLEFNPENGEAHVILGRIYEKKVNYTLAIKEFEDAIRAGINDELLHRDLDMLHFLNGDYDLLREKSNITSGISSVLKDYTFQELENAYKKREKVDFNLDKIIENTDFKIKDDAKANQDLIKLLESNKNKELVSEKLGIKIIRTPFFRKMPKDELAYVILMPIGIAQIVHYLRTNGFEIDQDDINIKIHYDNEFGYNEKRIDEEIFYDENRIIEYSNGREDTYIDSILERVEQKTRLDGYNVILLSAPSEPESSSPIMFMLAFTKYIKKKYKPIIIIGGFDPAKYSIIKNNNQNIDFIIQNAGERPLFKILLALKHKIDIKKIPGLEIKDNGKLIIDLGAPLPVKPDFTGLPVDKYAYKNLRRVHKLHSSDREIRKILAEFNESKIIISPFRLIWGCPYVCIFCTSSGNKLSAVLSIEKSLSYLKELKEKYGITKFFFINETLNISQKYVNGLCDEIIKSRLNISWCDCVRMDNIDRDMLFKLREAGCIRLIYGMETASPRMLHYIDKRISLKQLEETIRWTDEAGIWCGLEIICGFPHEKKEDVELTVDFIKRNGQYINELYYNIFSLRDGSILLSNPKKFGIENIFEVTIDQHPLGELLTSSLVRYGYDEIGGLKWNDALKKAIVSNEYVKRETKKKYAFPYYEVEHFLFFLYSKYKDKKNIVRIFDKASKYIFTKIHKQEKD